MRHSNRFLLIAFLGLLLSYAWAQEKFPTGTFTGGEYTLSFSADGVHTVSTGDKVVVKGNYTVNANEISIVDKEGDFACIGQTGKYTWKLDGKNLSFTKVSDDCDGRVQGLTAQPWVKK